MNKKKIIIMSALLLVLVAVVVGITYAVYTFTGNSTLNTIDLGRISMSYTEPSNAYVLDNALPMTDEEGKGQNNYFEFTVTSHATTKESDSVGITIPYEINISDIAIDEGMLELSKSLMKVNLVKVDGMTESEVVVPTLMSSLSASTLNTGASVVYQANDTHKNGSTTITSKYRLRAWITEGFDVSATENTYQYKFRVNVNSSMAGTSSNQAATKLLRTAIMDQGVVNSGNGLYMSTQTNDGRPTYYYRGAVENNYVALESLTQNLCLYNGLYVVNLQSQRAATENECITATSLCDVTKNGTQAGYAIGMDQTQCEGLGYTVIEATPSWEEIYMLWRVVRINEDNTIRVMLDTDMSSLVGDIDDSIVYYSNSNVTGGIMKSLNNLYNGYLAGYDNKIATSTFCEAAKVTPISGGTTIDNAQLTYYEEYTSDFRCEEDGNGHGLITDQKIGLISIDEAIHAGLQFNDDNFTQSNTYFSSAHTLTTSPKSNSNFPLWLISSNRIETSTNITSNSLQPVINLSADVMVTGNGTSTSPWLVTK